MSYGWIRSRRSKPFEVSRQSRVWKDRYLDRLGFSPPKKKSLLGREFPKVRIRKCCMLTSQAIISGPTMIISGSIPSIGTADWSVLRFIFILQLLILLLKKAEFIWGQFEIYFRCKNISTNDLALTLALLWILNQDMAPNISRLIVHLNYRLDTF